MKSCITGLTTKEVVSEYTVDDDGKLKMTKQKVNEKTIPPNTDIIKMVYQYCADNQPSYDKMSDEELAQEKARLLKLLKESEDAGRTSKSKGKM